MSGLGSWLDRRSPRPPADLAERVRAVSAEVADDAASEGGEAAGEVVDDSATPERAGGQDGYQLDPLAQTLLQAAVDRIAAARASPGRVRRSAFDLLVADSLITYACEAALEADRPAEALARLIDVGKVG